MHQLFKLPWAIRPLAGFLNGNILSPLKMSDGLIRKRLQYPLDYTATYCYECHEEPLHNPVFTPQDGRDICCLVGARGFSEEQKGQGREIWI